MYNFSFTPQNIKNPPPPRWGNTKKYIKYTPVPSSNTISCYEIKTTWGQLKRKI